MGSKAGLSPAAGKESLSHYKGAVSHKGQGLRCRLDCHTPRPSTPKEKTWSHGKAHLAEEAAAHARAGLWKEEKPSVSYTGVRDPGLLLEVHADKGDLRVPLHPA